MVNEGRPVLLGKRATHEVAAHGRRVLVVVGKTGEAFKGVERLARKDSGVTGYEA